MTAKKSKPIKLEELTQEEKLKYEIELIVKISLKFLILPCIIILTLLVYGLP